MSTKAKTETTTESMVSLKKAANAEQGAITVIRPSKLAEEGKTGVVAEGTFEGGKPNKFAPEKNDYFIRGADNTLYIINSTQSLAEQLGQPGLEGMKVKVVYNGKKPSKKKGGKAWHDFEVFAAKN